MDKAQTIKKEAEELLGKMIDNFEVEIEEDNGVYQVIIKTEENAPTVIGRHGETIRAIQKILEVVLYKTLGESVPLLVNVNDYREKQNQRLESLAAQMAEKTQSAKRATQMRGLSSYERKVIHEYITTNYPNLTTYSVGEGRDRYLVVDMKGNEPKQNENGMEE
ncbi:MAG: KH domain-containing protein [Candidatus Roizmanbacteria bacterium]|nr:MAG: KH domain-containing protein [Candidatus Roizmanbacteria bacterium]